MPYERQLLTQNPISPSSSVSRQMAHSSRQSRRRGNNVHESPQILVNGGPPGIRLSSGTGRETVDHSHRQPKTVRPSASVSRTIHWPVVPEEVWWASSQLINPETQQREEIETKERVRQDWLRRLRPRRSRGSGADHGRDNSRGK